MKQLKVIIEKHTDGYVGYPLGLKGVVVGQGDTYEEALADVKSAIEFHLETFGDDELTEDSPILEVFVAESGVNA
ncbi:MAG: type II toxin-antitoxin system HicB family antitoxin [Chloroflexota bacterium]|nr:type II toxin-antitoxin system HicB family antitoxin [Chloroflexota bacterium]